MSISRRDFLAQSAVAIALGAAGRPAVARAWQQQPQAPPWTPTFTPMRRNVGFFTGRGGTIGYLINKGAVVVVDAQFPDSAKACLDGLNERSRNRGVDLLINTHHHGDHTAGNVAFRGVAKRVLAHQRAVELQKEVASRANPPTDQLYADRTLTEIWREQLGDEWIRAKFYGPAHTSGDIVVTFERANVAHMGDLMFNRRHAVVDRPAGALMSNWIAVVEKAAADHHKDTSYIFGHAGANLPVTGTREDLMVMRDYLTALLAFVQGEIKAGKTRDEILAITAPLKGFDSHGPLNRTILTNAYGELTGTEAF